MSRPQRRPPWLKLRPLQSDQLEAVHRLTRSLSLHTICQEAACPNRPDCFGASTVTFLILGNTCTRNCRFCKVQRGEPSSPDAGEPSRLAQAVERLGLAHVVLTSVTRDDLRDGGAGHFAACTRAVHARCPQVTVEALVPDFCGSTQAIHTVVEAGVAVFAHNIETVPSLYGQVRPDADYHQSLDVLRTARQLSPTALVKSGIMLGLGETSDEVRAVLADLRGAGADAVTLGQYLQPSRHHHPVREYITPEAFAGWKEEAYRLGFSLAEAGPLVRSSYRARALPRPE